MVTYDREQATVSVEKELLVCEYCECVIGAKDHIRFLAKKLGILSYGNPTLIMANQEELTLADKEDIKKHKAEAEPSEGRPVMFKVLCPRCRRIAMLKDEYGQSSE